MTMMEKLKDQAIEAMRQADGKPRKLGEMQAAMAMPERARESEPATPNWSLWDEANSTCAALRNLSRHILQTASTLEANLQEVERLLGQMPKRS